MFGSKAQNIIIVKRKAQLECLGHGYDAWPPTWPVAVARIALCTRRQLPFLPFWSI